MIHPRGPKPTSESSGLRALGVLGAFVVTVLIVAILVRPKSTAPETAAPTTPAVKTAKPKTAPPAARPAEAPAKAKTLLERLNEAATQTYGHKAEATKAEVEAQTTKQDAP